MKAVVLIPAYEPGPSLVRVAERLVKSAFEKIVVVDDGSAGDKKKIFRKLRGLSGKIVVLEHAVNMGKGAALKTGFNYILLKFPRVSTIVTADADGQHKVPDILKVAQAGAGSPNALVIGARTFAEGVPLRSKFGNELTKKVFWFFSGLSLCDTQSGLRAIPPDLARKLMKVKANGYEFEMEMLVNLKQWKTAVREVPIETVYEDNNASSHFNPFKDSMRIYFVFLRYTLASIASFAVDYSLFLLAYRMLSSVYASTYIARSVSMLVNFSLNKKAVFKHGDKAAFPLFQYLALVVLSALASSVLTDTLFRYLRLPLPLAKILSDSSLYFVNFAVQREVIFKQEVEGA